MDEQVFLIMFVRRFAQLCDPGMTEGQRFQPGRGRSCSPASINRLRTVFGLTPMVEAMVATLSPFR